MYACMYVLYVCMYMVYTYQTAPIHVLYRTTHYVLLCVIQASIESFHINMAVTSGGCCGLSEDQTVSLQPAVTFITCTTSYEST